MRKEHAMRLASEEWTGESRLSDVLQAHPDALRRLSDIEPRLAHLQSEESGRMARLVRLDELARMAELPLETVIAAIKGDRIAGPSNRAARAEGALPIEEPGAARLDVRPMIAAGQEPFSAIMAAAARIDEGGTLLLDAPFDPAPLRRVLAGKGFTSQGRRIADGHWRIAFRRGNAQEAPAPLRTGEAWEEVDGAHLDVRGLEPPQPMVQILALIDAGGVDRLTVHHERDPLFLYPELDARGWSCRIVADTPGEVRLELSRRK
jgi:uncharacterized protein (DUF2249 family)